MSITVPLPTDTNNRRFVGPQGKLPAGKPTSDVNYDATSAVLVAADGETVLVATRTPVQPAGITVTTTSTLLLAANANRKYALIQNDGPVAVYINLAGTAIVGRGIRLAPNGGAYEMSALWGNLSIGNINGIVASGTSTTMATEET